MILPKALRIEWCKARARAHRWQEECLLLAEEMQRVIAFFTWQAKWWSSYTAERNLLPPHPAWPPNVSIMSPIERVAFEDQSRKIEGKIAYAHRQAHIRESMRQFCEEKWLVVRRQLQSMEERDAKVMVECH